MKGDGLKETHKSLKLVTHCNDDENTLAQTIKEYLAYKIYNELTENSLKVQLVHINYQDSDGKQSYQRFGILLEDIDELAERMNGQEIEGFGKTMAAFSQTEMQTFAMFQYFIGNEDWRIPFMRNVKFIQLSDNKTLIPVPYDFDASGLVAANYAKPDRDLQLKCVKQRAFMGYFGNKTERNASIELFNAKKAVFYKLVEKNAILSTLQKQEILDYFDTFYQTINTPKYKKQAIPLKGKKGQPSNVEGGFPTS